MRETKYPRITVVMPSFNQAKYIAESIRSVLDQDYPNLEFIILDGGSTDGSQNIIKQYATQLSYWHSQPDNGQSHALIQGFEHSTGDLIGWVNSDDVLLPECLKRIALAYLEQPNAGLFGGNYILIDNISKIIRCRRHPRNPELFAKFGLFVVNQPGSFFRRDDYKAVGGLNQDLHYVMDTDLYVRMMNKGTKFAYIDAYLSGFRIHSNAKTVSQIQMARVEGTKIRKLYWPKKISRFRAIGILSYYMYQVANGNFTQSISDSFAVRGLSWQEYLISSDAK